MSPKKRDARYQAVGMHEYGHAMNAERSRYPKLRAAGSNILDKSSLGLGSMAGLIGRSRFGAGGGAIIGAGVSGLTSLPLLIEEHQATKNALKMMKEDGELSDEEYKRAQKSLSSAYKSYVTNALNRAAISGGVGSGNLGVVTGSLGGAVGASTYTNRSLKRNLSDIQGNSADIRSLRRMRTRAGLKADMYMTPNKGQLPDAAYAPPHKHVENFVSRDEYKKMLQARTKQRISKRTLDRGAVFIPQYEKNAVFIPQGVTTAAKHVRNAASGTRNVVKNLAEDAVNFGKDGPYTQASRFVKNYTKDPTFRGNVNTYALGKANNAAYKVQTSPLLEPIRQVADDAAGIFF
jgi:hypothetical protein